MTRSGSSPIWLLMTALVIAEISSTFEVSMAFAALPTLTRHFGDPLGASWIITIFFIVSAGTAALFSRMGDIYGRRRILIVVLLIAACGSMISALSSSLTGVILGRMLQGATGAVLPLCIGLMRENFEAKVLPFYIGIMGGVVGVSAGLAFLVAGYIIDQFDWHSMFFFSTIIALVGVVSIWLIVPPSKPSPIKGRLDILGGALFAPAIACLLYAMNAAKDGWLHLNSGGLTLFALAMLVIWARHELKHPTPLIDVRLFADRRILLANLVFAAVAVGPMLYPQIIIGLAQQPLWTGVGLGLSVTAAALLKQPSTFMGIFAGPIGGRISARYGSRCAMLVGTGSLVFGWILPFIHMNSMPMLIVVVVTQSFGMVLLYGAVSNQIVEAAPTSRTSEALGLAQVTRSTFTAIGSQVIAALLASSMISDTTIGSRSYPSEHAYMLAFGFLLVSSVAACIAAWLLPRPLLTHGKTEQKLTPLSLPKSP